MENKFKSVRNYLLSKEKLLKMYQDILKIRYFENKIIDLYSKGLMPGLAHLYI